MTVPEPSAQVTGASPEQPAEPPRAAVATPTGRGLPASSWMWVLAAYLGALVVVLVGLAVVTVLAGASPERALATALRDSLLTTAGLAQTLNRMTPLLLAALAFSLAYHVGLFNIGMDGQLYAGAILATGLGFLLGTALPAILLVPLLLLAGGLGGALFSAPAVLLRIRWGVNEIFTTVMLNFVALYLVAYLCTGPWNDPMAGEAITRPLPFRAALPLLVPSGGGHSGIVLAVLLAVALAWFLSRTVFGLEVRSVGGNPRAARFAGIALARIQITAFCVGGALAGLAGAIEVLGVYHRLLVGLSPNYGIIAILVAVLGRNHPLWLIPATFLFAVLVAASDSLQRTAGLPASAVLMIQGLAVLVVLVMEAVRARRARFVV